MASRKIGKRPLPKNSRPGSHGWLIVGLVAVLLVGGVVVAVVATRESSRTSPTLKPNPAGSTGAGNPAPSQPPTTSGSSPSMESMEVAKAVMVTVQLDFGSKLPSIAEALSQVERRYVPDDGVGRTFAILDAYGEPTPDGSKLHMSMHVSSEKPGLGSLVFRRTGEVLWHSRINATSAPPAHTGKNLTIMVDNGAGRALLIDGTNNPRTLLDANVKEMGVPLHSVWPDGAEREVTFVYSACGCPVKVMVRRVGQRTVRTKELPVIFPDDPAAVSTINKLMGW